MPHDIFDYDNEVVLETAAETEEEAAIILLDALSSSFLCIYDLIDGLSEYILGSIPFIIITIVIKITITARM